MFSSDNVEKKTFVQQGWYWRRRGDSISEDDLEWQKREGLFFYSYLYNWDKLFFQVAF
jgi:hypothetical protein